MLIQDESIYDITEAQDDAEHYDADIYNFALACVGKSNVQTQLQTNTQQIILSQESHGNKINPNWIFLDSQSTINICNNKKMFKYIRKCKPHEYVRCYCNGGYQDTNQIGEVPGIGLVYFNPKSLANIVSLSQIDTKYRVTYNSAVAKAFTVHGTSTGDKKFIRSKGGLHYYDTF